jgi:Zn-dependent peptidase ImmA (M78 family)/DNA-binding XRE family transcriptional regulator
MVKSATALIKPEMLVWARESSGFSAEDAAAKIGVSNEKLESWERGDALPTVVQLRKAAQVFKRPFAVFYLPAPPTDFSVPHDYRRHPGTTALKLSPSLLVEIRRIQYQREAALLLASDDAVDFSYLGTATIESDVREVAAQARKIIGISLDQQLQWPSSHAALNGWRAALEALDILVFQLDGVDVSEVRGLAISHRRFPIIAANAKDHPNARIFTLLHEFCHLLLNQSGICDLEESRHPRGVDQLTERFCNAVAAATLVPHEALAAAFGISDRPRPQRWSDAQIGDAAKAFGVSREVIVRHLVTIGAAPFDFYLFKREQFRREFAEHQDRQKEGQKTGFQSPATKAVYKVGPEFARIVLSAYDREDITSSDLTAYLGVRFKHVPRIRQLAFKTPVEESAD